MQGRDGGSLPAIRHSPFAVGGRQTVLLELVATVFVVTAVVCVGPRSVVVAVGQLAFVERQGILDLGRSVERQMSEGIRLARAVPGFLDAPVQDAGLETALLSRFGCGAPEKYAGFRKPAPHSRKMETLDSALGYASAKSPNSQTPALTLENQNSPLWARVSNTRKFHQIELIRAPWALAGETSDLERRANREIHLPRA